ncbi:hypothetical protein M2302_002463 [Micromonospora sp. A200]|nr:hypothetical protein [Micromonospora sp. A200]
MANLPFVIDGCGEPAAVRIEVYSGSSDGGSLDAVAYACPDHPEPAADAITAAGFTAAAAASVPGVERKCGDVHVFATGTLAADWPLRPRWCDRAGCHQRGEHRSRVTDVDTNRSEASILTVGLVQTTHPAAEPVVALTATVSTTAHRVVLSIGHARVLRYRLSALTDAIRYRRR